MFVLKLRSFSICPGENCNNCFYSILPLTDFFKNTCFGEEFGNKSVENLK